jgi:hypothetical protein
VTVDVRLHMAITKRGSRRIVVDGARYRWTVRRKPSYSQALVESSLTFAVELETANGSVLVVDTGTARPDNWLKAPTSVVTPKLVEHSVRAAIAKGWRPAVKGKPHVLRVQPNSALLSDASTSPLRAQHGAAKRER